MVLKKILSSTISVIIIVSIAFVMINLLHLIYCITDPDGIGGIQLFLETVTIVIVILGVIIYACSVIYSFLKTLYLKTNPSTSLKSQATVLAGILAFLLMLIFQNGYIFASKRLADKYKLLKVSEKLISEGEYRLALAKAEQAYERYNEFPNVKSFFILSKFYYQSSLGAELATSKQYSSIINYAFCIVKNNGDLNLAEKLFKRALELSNRSILKTDEGSKVFPYSSLANLELDRGNYSKAEYYNNELLKIVSKVADNDLEYIFQFQEVYAAFNTSIGNTEKAKSIRERNVSLWEKSYPEPKGSMYLSLLLLAASSEIFENNYPKAGEYLVKAQSIALKKKKKSGYMSFIQLKGIYCSYYASIENGKLELLDGTWMSKVTSLFNRDDSNSLHRFRNEAESCFQEYLSIADSKNGKQSIEYIQGLKMLLNFYKYNGNNEKTATLSSELREVIQIYKNSNQDLYYDALLNITSIEFRNNGYNYVENSIKELEDYHFDKLAVRYSFFTESEKEYYKNIIDNRIAVINEIYVASNSKEAAGRIYNNLLATKQVALYANEDIRKNILLADKPLQKEYYDLLEERDRVEKHKKVDEYVEILNKEKLIKKKLDALKQNKPFDPRNLHWKDVQLALKDKEAAIEFFTTTDGKSYYAVIIEKGDENPRLISLFQEAELQKVLDQAGSLKERVDLIYVKNYQAIYSLIWTAIDEELKDPNRVFISLAGILHGVSFPALIQESKYEVVLLGSTRQVVNNKSKDLPNSFALVGGVEYGLAESKNNKPTRGYFKNLPYTMIEIQSIESIIKKFDPTTRVQILTKNTATEKEFYKLESLKPAIIHLATHGYFYQKKNASLPSNLLSQVSSNPMLRSGIILAGANNSGNQVEKNDGFLSAQEIARRNFSFIDLAVLSACETGLGEEIGSEGIFGLQRAFKLAGTRSIIMSIWKVPDKETSELMAYFYENFLIKGMSKSKSLQDAQYKVRSKKETSSPYYWGGFILLER
jgi:CHAT domain-containing protein